MKCLTGRYVTNIFVLLSTVSTIEPDYPFIEFLKLFRLAKDSVDLISISICTCFAVCAKIRQPARLSFLRQPQLLPRLRASPIVVVSSIVVAHISSLGSFHLHRAASVWKLDLLLCKKITANKANVDVFSETKITWRNIHEHMKVKIIG